MEMVSKVLVGFLLGVLLGFFKGNCGVTPHC